MSRLVLKEEIYQNQNTVNLLRAAEINESEVVETHDKHGNK